IWSKQYQLTALSLVVVFLYGGLLWYVFPVDPKISWEGHLSGIFVGLIFAVISRSVPLVNKKYEWEREDFDSVNDDFSQQFDEDGNFVGQPKEIEEALPEPIERAQIKVVYTIKKEDTGSD